MRTPRPANTPINAKRRTGWRNRFQDYRFTVNDTTLVEWVQQFSETDRDIAARVLDCVEYISNESIDKAFRSLLRRVSGWHRHKNKRNGKFVFVPYSRTAGESGDSMLHRFRLANGLNTRHFNSLFIGRSELLRENLGKEDTVVFIDDFVGTGNQAVEAWNQIFQELTAGIGNVYLITVAAYVGGINRVSTETGMTLLCHINLTERDSVLQNKCVHFTQYEKETIGRYCRKASTDKPWGYGDCGLVIVLAHQCPNNSLAILQETSKKWVPLFPRS